MTIPTPMRERCANAARKYLRRCVDLGAPINYADLADAVLAEIETPTEAMIGAGCSALSKPEAKAPLMAGELAGDHGATMARNKMRLRHAAMIRAAREGK